MYSSASSGVKAPEYFKRSQKQTAIQPSTLRMSVSFLAEVTSSTARAYSRKELLGNSFIAKAFTSSTRRSGFVLDLICAADRVSKGGKRREESEGPCDRFRELMQQNQSSSKSTRGKMDVLSLLDFRMVSTNSRGVRPISIARVNSAAAPSSAPPNRSPIVRSPATRDETRSFPARVVMTVVMAPETAGPCIISEIVSFVERTNSKDKSRKRGEGRRTYVIGGEHENHLEEFAGVRRKSSLEPKQRDDSSDTDVLLEHVRDSHSSVEKFLSSLVRDRAVDAKFGQFSSFVVRRARQRGRDERGGGEKERRTNEMKAAGFRTNPNSCAHL